MGSERFNAVTDRLCGTPFLINDTAPHPAMRRPASRPTLPALALLALLPLVAGCEQIAELLELPNPARDAARVEAEGRAIGSACRHAGRSLEDCYTLNASADKASVFAGWRDMNDYMMEHKLEVVPSQFTQLPPTAGTPAAAEASTPSQAAAPGTSTTR